MAETLGGNITVVPGYAAYTVIGSGTIEEGRVVAIDTTFTDDVYVVEAPANSMRAIGYVDAEWETGDIVTVYDSGIARLYAATSITIGDLVGCAAAGEIKKYVGNPGTSGVIIGTALESISASAFGKVLVNITPAVRLPA